MLDHPNMVLEQTGFTPSAIAKNGCRFLSGNGYLGLRGTLAEYGAEQLSCVNLSGIYHLKKGSDWREPLNAPHPLRARLMRDGLPVALPDTEPEKHRQYLRYDMGLQGRETVFPGGIAISEERFASMSRPHLLCMRWQARWEDEARYEVESPIDCRIWDLNGPHFERFEGEGDEITAHTDDGKQVAVCRSRQVERGEKSLTLTIVAAVYTSQDGPQPALLAQKALMDADYDTLLQEQQAVWADLWKDSRVLIEGDPEAQQALDVSLYHLWCIAPRQGGSVSIGARGLSGQTYKGAVFWDTEMFMLDFYLHTRPELARPLLRYRIDSLPGAMEKARQYGWKGAFYAWESQEGGRDACSDYNVTDVFTGRPMRTFFKDKQVHITADVVWGLEKYRLATGDDSLYREGGDEVLLQAARFYESLLYTHPGCEEYQILDVIGPDEYHERVNNNYYTNEMARFTLRLASERLKGTGRDEAELARFAHEAEHIKRPVPNAEGVIPQFDGYFALEDATLDEVRSRLLNPKEYWGGAYGVASHTQIIKQADVIALMVLFSHEPETVAANYAYYCPRTEHGSSLSACMYAQAACRMGRPQEAYPLFMRSATADIAEGGKEWAGLVYIGGTHPAAAGGAYQVLLYGFLGMEPEGETPRLHPRLPDGWQAVELSFCHRGRRWHARAEANGSVALTEITAE